MRLIRWGSVVSLDEQQRTRGLQPQKSVRDLETSIFHTGFSGFRERFLDSRSDFDFQKDFMWDFKITSNHAVYKLVNTCCSCYLASNKNYDTILEHTEYYYNTCHMSLHVANYYLVLRYAECFSPVAKHHPHYPSHSLQCQCTYSSRPLASSSIASSVMANCSVVDSIQLQIIYSTTSSLFQAVSFSFTYHRVSSLRGTLTSVLDKSAVLIYTPYWLGGWISEFQISRLQDFEQDFGISKKISTQVYEISG